MGGGGVEAVSRTKGNTNQWVQIKVVLFIGGGAKQYHSREIHVGYEHKPFSDQPMCFHSVGLVSMSLPLGPSPG